MLKTVERHATLPMTRIIGAASIEEQREHERQAQCSDTVAQGGWGVRK
jgi:hypothetical protein